MAVINDNVARRGFLSSAFMTLGLCLGFGMLGARFSQFLVPKVAEKEFSEVLIGSADDIPEGGVKQIEVVGIRLALMKRGGVVTAFSRKCTDLGCLVSWDAVKEQFICPCHNGIYDKEGKNIAGPPPRPLDRYVVVRRGDSVYVKVQVS